MAQREFITEETFLSVYRKKLKEAREREMRFIVTAVSPHDEYAERVGFIRAIEEALTLFDEVQKHFFPEYRN